MHCIDQKWQFILLQNIFYFINAGYLSFVFYKRILETIPSECITISTNILSSITVFNIKNIKKGYLSSKSSAY